MLVRRGYAQATQHRFVWMMFFGYLLGGLLIHGDAISQAEEARYIITFQEGTAVATQGAIITANGGTLLQQIPLINAMVIQLPTDRGTAVLNALRSHPEVRDIVVDTPLSAQSLRPDEGSEGEGGEHGLITLAAPEDVDYGYTWNLLQIALDAVHPTAQGTGIHVAVLDTGIDASHPALVGAVAGGYNARAGEDEADYMDRNGHGTHMAGIIAARLLESDDAGEGPTRGVAPGAFLYAIRVLDDAGGGFVSDVINGLSWVSAHPEIRVVNLSFGFYKEAPYPLLAQVVQRLYDAGVVMVAAAGNYRADCVPTQGAYGEGGEGGSAPPTATDCNTQVKFPARYPETIAVAATDSLSHVASYSLGGEEIDVVAPGGSRLTERVVSTHTTSPGLLPLPDGEDDDEGAEDVDEDDGEDDGTGLYGWGSGTSQAAAHVTGLVALLLSANPHLTPEEVRMIVQTTAVDVGFAATVQGAGLIDAARAVRRAQQLAP